MSTQVYRLRVDGRVLYLRAAEAAEDSLAPEVEVHRRLLEAGGRVPEIVAFFDLDAGFGRSIAITSEIAGTPVGDDPSNAETLRAAGRDAARIAAIDVQDFGWVRRDMGKALVGEDGAYLDYVRAPISKQMDALTRMLGPEAVGALEHLLASLTPIDDAHLAHGDLDGSHIYIDNGTYSGLIDFGEIKGAERHYDLAHFFLHYGDTVTNVIDGYREIDPSEIDRERLRWTAIVIGAHRVAWAFTNRGEAAAQHPAPRWYAKRTSELLLS